MEPFIASIVTALISSVVGALVGAIVSTIKTLNLKNAEAKRDADELKELVKQSTLMTCRMAIYDEHFSTDEKLDAYEIYRDLGGNHQTKKYMDETVGGDVDEYLEKHRGRK